MFVQSNSTISIIISYYGLNINLFINRAPFLHPLYISFINHFIAFSCHSDFGCIANPLSLARNFILLFGASIAAWCYALCSHSASHRGAICTHSLTSKLVASFLLIISEYFDTRYLRSCSIAKRYPFRRGSLVCYPSKVQIEKYCNL